MGKETARPAPEKENGKQEGVLKDDDLKDVVGAGLDSYVEHAVPRARPADRWRLTTRPTRRRRRRAPAPPPGADAVTFGGARWRGGARVPASSTSSKKLDSRLSRCYNPRHEPTEPQGGKNDG